MSDFPRLICLFSIFAKFSGISAQKLPCPAYSTTNTAGIYSPANADYSCQKGVCRYLTTSLGSSYACIDENILCPIMNTSVRTETIILADSQFSCPAGLQCVRDRANPTTAFCVRSSAGSTPSPTTSSPNFQTTSTGFSMCQDHWTYNSQTGYYYCLQDFTSGIYSFAYAENYCVAFGGHLVSIHSDVENAYVLKMATASTVNQVTMANDACYGSRVWIGYRGTGAIGKGTWTDGTSDDYSHGTAFAQSQSAPANYSWMVRNDPGCPGQSDWVPGPKVSPFDQPLDLAFRWICKRKTTP
ncbi:unnamed protein product, partial [Mesorhabditis belari]|uniref:C-type lectin domain-containing protein n=1 Tax=Mesorhabditis belari TaxID=2138241 RepID=A0AAF3ES02_9BILA